MDADYQGIFVAIVGFAVLFLVLRGVYSFFAGFVQGYRSSHSQPPKPHAATPTERTQYARPAARVDRGTAPVPSRIFLSYRRTDSADVTGRIFDRLSVQFAKEKIFKDVDSIPLGVDFRTYIDSMVAKSDVFLAVIGPDWAGRAGGVRRIDDPRDHVRLEVKSALTRNIPVIPLLVRNASMPTETDLPEEIRDLAYRNGVPVRSDPDFNNDMARLLSGMKKLHVSDR
ncbi:MAG: toll/interleukin-1 receptor domain-containing protein [Chromatiaceae bacterium]|nr:toll/interleukin-1 receptor domain-containing protein [Gammaproteobacteria bacterium]MCP5300831.1 toll/interleukin-1 receptor domain-containing protein [Chromatiaceae bacterium]MCP5421696.1 toll/interleukin-1 receptor domain-containing protein [Chromatiaceae bacterium]